MSDQRIVADVMVERLRAWGVSRLFGYSGDGINSFMGALRRAGGPTLVQARHEENAALMAVGHAKYTGETGVMVSTQGPGAVHLLNGLYDAKLDHVPVVAIVGQQQTSVLGSEYQQEIDLQSLFKDVSAQFLQTMLSPEQAPMVIDRAFRTARTTRSPCVVVIPHDVQQEPMPEDLPHEHGVMVTAPGWNRPHVLPHAEDLQRAADVLNAGERVALLVGQGVRDAGDVVRAVAERLDAGVTTSLLGKPWWDESLPYSCGVMGHLGNRYPVEVGLTGDATDTLSALLPLIHQRSPGPWIDQVRGWVDEWHDLAERRAGMNADPLSPELVVRALSDRLPNDALVSVDVGSVTYWYARHLRLPPGVPAHLSSTLATMGSAVPYGLAAKLSAPRRPVVALSGDGAMQMNGIAELVTVAHRWRDWADPRFVVLVLHNRDLAEVTWEQREMEGEPRFDESQDLPSFPYAAYAELLGLRGIRVTEPGEVDAAWEAALSSDRPVVIEALTGPDTPLLPPFPAGREKLETFHAGLDAEGPAGQHARALLDEQASMEGHRRS
ncbi:thiamine pyrophosphate-binding protein [Nocardioides sp. InS609-2]|uniref:thiamine pyrophosphate-binding protein n=1 Tax=Nocardioides sp. InS609-2 TaxID=2760705 RepID=UPI0020BDD179|nr:thiamine pyrophosphate-binding protein [Nocardioides sp. InS609-2]